MTFERRQGRHDANHGVLLFTLLDCGLVKYYIVAGTDISGKYTVSEEQKYMRGEQKWTD